MALDVDFDQPLDLALVPQRYTPNAATELFVWDKGVPRHLGQFMSPRLDAKARQITTREKGGHAGMLFKAQTYGWQQRELRLLREVEQVVGEKSGTYERITRSYAEGKAPLEKRERVVAPAGP